MQFLLQYPDLLGSGAELLDAGSVTELAVAAERAGFAGFSFTEHPAPGARWLDAGGHQTLDPFVALGAVAAVTTRLKLLTYLAVLPYRNPLLTAKAAATVDSLSNGRFILGAGTGYLKTEFFALGADFDERNERFDEALDVMPMHWKGEPFSYQGKHFAARDIVARPRPVQNPIPIWLGGNSKLTLRRVAERAQGWMPLIGPAEMSATTRTPHLDSVGAIAEPLAVLRDLAGERFASLDICVSYDGASPADPSAPGEGGDRRNDPSADVERRRDAMGRLGELGVTWVVVSPPWAPHPAAMEFVDSFAATHLSP